MTGAMFIPELEQEAASTRRALERIPEDKLDFKPHEKSWTLRQLAGHVANINNWTPPTLDRELLDMDTLPPQPDPRTKDDILALHDQAVAGAKAALEGASAEDLQVNWSLKAGGHVHFTMPRAAVLRSFVMNHLVHHRGQLMVYLRLLDVPVPGMYGPSADEM